MRCRNCEYRLWNISSRECPECGRSFKPSEFEFVPNSVCFCCPHCSQAYYGTGARGHLVPLEFECIGCDRHVHMDQMVLLPAEGVQEESTGAPRMPWLNRTTRHVLGAWFSTVGKALVAPGRLIRLTPLGSSIGEAWYFVLFTSVLILLVAMVPFVLFMVVMSGFAATAGGAGPPVAAMAGPLAIFSLVVLVGTLVIVALWGAVAHGLLRMTGSTASGIGRTYQALCYSSGANVVSVIPCAGYYFGWIWWLVSAILMVREGQKVHGGRASLAVLSLPVLLIAGAAALYIWSFIWATSFAITGGGTMAPAYDATQIVLDGLDQYANEHDNRWPRHAIELVSGDYLDGFDFVSTGSDTFEEHVRFAGTDLEAFQQSSAQLQLRKVEKAKISLPPGTIAHRMGDFVFTYHGIDPDTADPRLWLVIMSPDPRVNTGKSADGYLRVGQMDGNVVVVQESDFSNRLAFQNQLRSREGLAPLPDPSQVTHTRPAVAKNQSAKKSEEVEKSKGQN